MFMAISEKQQNKLNTHKPLSQPLLDSHLLADMVEPESRGEAEHPTQSRRALKRYMAKCGNMGMGEKWGTLIFYSGLTEECYRQ